MLRFTVDFIVRGEAQAYDVRFEEDLKMSETAPSQSSAVPMPPYNVLTIILGFWQSRALAIAAELELADLLADGPQSVDVLAERTKTHSPSLFRLMRALESIGYFTQVSPRVFANTASSALLRKNVPGSQWALVRATLSTGFGQYDSWAEILHSIRTGKTALEKVYGCEAWEFFNSRPEVWAVFNESMRSVSAEISPAVAQSYDWGRFSVVADIGGGIGSQLVAILDAHPSVRGILFDAPSVVAQAIPHARTERVSGDFFKSVPVEADAYVLRSIIHDWPEPEALAILKNVRHAMKPHSRLVLIERIVPETAELAPAKWLDLHMLAVAGGRERTAAEYEELYGKSGFDLERIIPTPAGASLVIGRPRA
jgi:O-methyltransferase domain/Dimerisation domain